MKKLFFLLISFLTICPYQSAEKTDQKTAIPYQNDAHRLIAAVVAKTGDYNDLKSLVDVTFQYTIQRHDGKRFVFNQKFIFENEQVWSERFDSTSNKKITQGFDGMDSWRVEKGVPGTDKEKLKHTRNSLKTGFYLFAFNQKLLDPGLIYKYVRKDTVADQFYDVVEVTFEENIGDYQDIYHFYINEETKLIDQFLLTILAYDVTEPEIVRCTYESFGPVMIPTYMKYTKSNWNGDILEDKWTEEISENLQFNTGVIIKKPEQ